MDIILAAMIITYWDCEVAYLRGEKLPEDMRECIAVSEEIKRQKFQGDFTAYLEWWRANKSDEYQKRNFKPH